ncbi:MAG: DUF2846 domain-containing protein [Rhodospirillaceae bacterium]|jgi:hypothetical protein|nr:DUF2846 domain-containing protein [Rhodospirillales bacterium]MBT3907562.1 DUF2846 domain-containing protein [Rhodospirillaceae bacterium]MBT4703520.1 DUF2846 domain-containing protein [Rhodospirillaceae bacterium]MBT5036288.1 DUF2846 domain-containing protein [Rhodospirillaceae bacterium]MBT6219177.1 DUF2846 domain-containing protein [Rhodospirillaceae bacterium]
MPRGILAIFMALMLASCVQPGQSYYELNDTRPVIEKGKARIYVFRETNITYLTFEARARVNGKAAIKLPNGAYAYWDVKPGSVSVDIIDTWDSTKPSSLNVATEVGQEYFVAVLPRQVPAEDGHYNYPTGKEEMVSGSASGFKLHSVHPDYGRWQITSLSPAGYMNDMEIYTSRQTKQ